MVDDLIKKLLEAGVHFGHQTQRWNPKMKRFIFGQRSGIYIIDLEKTVECINLAKEFVRDVTGKGGKILFVGTKKQAQIIVEEEAQKAKMYYVKNRWLGGLLTNFETVKGSIKRLHEIEQMSENGVWENLTKKETARLSKEKNKLLNDLGGIREMKKLPDVIFMIDPKKEDIAVKEATKLGIPIVAIVDTNCNPELVEYPIPGNDDALKAIRLITSLITESMIEGSKEYEETQPKPTKKEEAKKQEAKKETVENEEDKAQGEEQEPAQKQS